MIPDRVRRAVEHWLPWYDEPAQIRREEVSDYIHQHSIDNRVASEHVIADGKVAISASRDRIRAAYLLAGARLDGRR